MEADKPKELPIRERIKGLKQDFQRIISTEPSENSDFDPLPMW